MNIQYLEQGATAAKGSLPISLMAKVFKAFERDMNRPTTGDMPDGIVVAHGLASVAGAQHAKLDAGHTVVALSRNQVAVLEFKKPLSQRFFHIGIHPVTGWKSQWSDSAESVISLGDAPAVDGSETIPFSVVKWLADGERGMSSEAICRAVFGLPKIENRDDRVAHPHDPADFRRCVELMRAVPDIRNHMGKLARLSPVWKRLVHHWDVLESLYEQEVECGKAPALYAVMHVLTEVKPKGSQPEPVKLTLADAKLLAACAHHGQKSEVERLLQAPGVNLHIMNDLPLRLAASTGDRSVVSTLIEAGADVNGHDEGRPASAAVCRAFMVKDGPMVNLLAKAGADLTVIRSYNRMGALANQYPAVKRALRSVSAQRDVNDVLPMAGPSM